MTHWLKVCNLYVEKGIQQLFDESTRQTVLGDVAGTSTTRPGSHDTTVNTTAVLCMTVN